MHTLRQYLEGRSKADFARTVGIVPVYLSQILSGHRTPSLRLMLRIQEATEGAVDLNSWAPRNDALANGLSGALPQAPEEVSESLVIPTSGEAA